MKIVNVLLTVLGLFLAGYFFLNYGLNNKFLEGGDSLGYYCYLPSYFIYDNITHMETSGNEKEVSEILKNYVTHPPYDNPKTPKDKNLVQYTMGIALMELPFFLIADGLAPLLGYPQDGFSRPYSILIKISNWFYLFLGLLFLFKSLVFYHPKSIAYVVCLFS